MAYTFLNGKRVSRDHATVLLAYRAKYGVWAQVNQGARTLAEQAHFYAIYLRYGRPLAARPWGGAPHIKWGANNHALDINAGWRPGQSQHVAAFYRSLGIPVAFNVSSEAWHMDTLDGRALARAADRLRKHDKPVIKPGAHGPQVKRLKRAMWAHGLRRYKRSTSLYGPPAVRAIKRLQKAHHLRPDGIVGPRTWKLLD